ncbi:MAG: hypothetical protein KH452_13645 [Clostridiales bacterium]|nr:hypothetical protein [Clostridiales bacterium]
MEFSIINKEQDEMINVILKELCEVFEHEDKVQNVRVHSTQIKETKCIFVEELCFTLATGIGINFIYDMLKGILKKYKNSQELKRNTKITIKEGEKIITVEVDEVMSK